MINIVNKSLIYDENVDQVLRLNKLRKIRNSKQEPSENYLKFGIDYFDNPNVLQGFGGYKYDGRFASKVRLFVDQFNPTSILEFGCAKGFLLYEFYKLGVKILGVDKSEYATKNAKREIVDCIYRSIRELPYGKLKRVDTVIFKDVLPHMEIEELQNTLKCVKFSCPLLKVAYVEHPVSLNEKHAQSIREWDPTLKHCQPADWWTSIFENYELNYYVYYKNLFNSGY